MVGPSDSFRMDAGRQDDSSRDERMGLSAQPPNSREHKEGWRLCSSLTPMRQNPNNNSEAQ